MSQPGQRYWSLIEPFWLSLNESWDAGPDQFSKMFSKVPPKVGDLYAAHWCQSEVRNGGFRQFFANTTGLLAPEALSGLRNIGIEPWAALLKEAMAFFGTPYPRDRAERRSRLMKSTGRKAVFGALDKRFFEWLHAEQYRWDRIADAYTEGEADM